MLNKGLNDYAKLLKKNCYTFMITKNSKTYFHFYKNSYFGYVQENNYKMHYDFSCNYIPNRKHGNCCQYGKQLELTLKNAERTLRWSADRIKKMNVKNYKNVDDFINNEKILKIEVLK